LDVKASSGNVFADMGLNNPEELLAKAELVQRICDIIAGRKLNQVRGARVLGVDHPKVSALLRGRLDGSRPTDSFGFSTLSAATSRSSFAQRAATRGPALGLSPAHALRKSVRISKTVDYGRERDMPDKPAVFVGDQRQSQGIASAQSFDPALSLVAVGMIGECGGDDLIDFGFVAGAFVADRRRLRAPFGVT
jgi:predicted XRE-type DNA-binding protein